MDGAALPRGSSGPGGAFRTRGWTCRCLSPKTNQQEPPPGRHSCPDALSLGWVCRAAPVAAELLSNIIHLPRLPKGQVLLQQNTSEPVLLVFSHSLVDTLNFFFRYRFCMNFHSCDQIHSYIFCLIK